MALVNALAALREKLKILASALDELHTTASEDCPASHAVADQCATAAENTLGFVQEAQVFARKAHRAARGRNLEEAREYLRHCHQRFLQAYGRLGDELIVSHRIIDIARLIKKQSESPTHRKGRKAWRGWVQTMHKGIDALQHCLLSVQQSLLEGWIDIADHGPQTVVTAKALGVKNHYSDKT